MTCILKKDWETLALTGDTTHCDVEMLRRTIGHATAISREVDELLVIYLAGKDISPSDRTCRLL